MSNDIEVREAFEKWCKAKDFGSATLTKGTPWVYELWRDSYQAGQAAQKEKDAKVCDAFGLENLSYVGATRCAQAIREG